jgi:hypothetical protein
MEHRTNSDNFRAGADWFLSPKSTLGALVTGNLGNWNGERENTTKLGGLYENPYDGLNADNRSRNTWQNLTYNLNFHRDLGEGSSLSLDADYAQWQRRNRQAVDNRYFSNEGNTTEADLLVRTLTETNIDILALQADYNRNIFGDWALEAGVKSSLVQTDNDLDFSTIEEEVKVTDTLRSNRFQYDENINAAYINISKKFNEKWQMQTGLRAEHTDSHGYSVTLDSTVQQNYLNFFPSASLSYTVKDKHSLSASYSRRVDRPNYQNLNPFEYFLDRFTFERGNPFLNPQFTDAYGLTYGFRNAAFLTLNYNVTRDAITQVLLQEASEQITYQTTVNLDRQRNYSANLAAPLPLAQWWTLNLNLTGFLNTIDSEFSEGGMVNKSRWSYNLRAQHTFTLPGDLKLELMGWYSSPQLWGIFNIQEQYQIDMGVSKTFGKLRVQASLDDVFNIRENRVEMMQGDIDTQIFNRWESRVFRLNLSYRFGNDKVKRSRRRGTASDDLRQRAND